MSRIDIRSDFEEDGWNTTERFISLLYILISFRDENMYLIIIDFPIYFYAIFH